MRIIREWQMNDDGVSRTAAAQFYSSQGRRHVKLFAAQRGSEAVLD